MLQLLVRERRRSDLEEHIIRYPTKNFARHRARYTRARYSQPDRRTVSFERRGKGFAVDAPHFYVWDRDRDHAAAWGSDLQAAIGGRSSPRGERE